MFLTPFQMYEVATIFSVLISFIFLIKHIMSCIVDTDEYTTVTFKIGYALPIILLNFSVYIIKF
ncbi:hypothetical protein GD1_101 [Paraglaciecola Antarctic GD virus 1]|nr:hypothetical protein GD1_101 [Paraglaciecola Antarctic GD virus 1]